MLKNYSENVSTTKVGVLNVEFAPKLTQDLQIFEKFNMSQMNPKEAFVNTAYSVQLLIFLVRPINIVEWKDYLLFTNIKYTEDC